MNITKTQLVAAGLRSRGQAFDDAARMLLAGLRMGQTPEEIAEMMDAIARSNFDESGDILVGRAPISGMPTYLPGVTA